MASKTAHDAAKKKAAKEKKMLVVLIVFLVVALGYAYKTLTKLHSSSAPQPVAAATTTAGSGAPSPTSSSSPPASSSSTSSSSGSVDVATGATSTPAAGPNGADSLVSAVTPPLDQGQLRSFTLFDVKDPFNSQGPAPTGQTGGSVTGPTSVQPSSGSSSSGSSSSGSSGSSSSSSSGSSSGSGSKPALAPPTSAVISVNGNSAVVSLNTVFPVTGDPATDGIFRLVALTQTSARIAVVGGSYASGAATLTLRVGRPVTLANTADGKRYTLELFPQGTTVAAAPASASGTSSSTPTTSTTPTS